MIPSRESPKATTVGEREEGGEGTRTVPCSSSVLPSKRSLEVIGEEKECSHGRKEGRFDGWKGDEQTSSKSFNVKLRFHCTKDAGTWTEVGE